MERNDRLRVFAAGAFAVLGLGVGPCLAVTLATCGGSAGKAYLLEGGLIKTDEVGWIDDGIKSGTIQLIQNGKDFDIVIGDASGGTFSARTDGATIVLLAAPDRGPVVAAIYPSATEVYDFDLAHGQVVWTQTKYTGIVDKVSVFVAPCQ